MFKQFGLVLMFKHESLVQLKFHFWKFGLVQVWKKVACLHL